MHTWCPLNPRFLLLLAILLCVAAAAASGAGPSQSPRTYYTVKVNRLTGDQSGPKRRTQFEMRLRGELHNGALWIHFAPLAKRCGAQAIIDKRCGRMILMSSHTDVWPLKSSGALPRFDMNIRTSVIASKGSRVLYLFDNPYYLYRPVPATQGRLLIPLRIAWEELFGKFYYWEGRRADTVQWNSDRYEATLWWLHLGYSG